MKHYMDSGERSMNFVFKIPESRCPLLQQCPVQSWEQGGLFPRLLSLVTPVIRTADVLNCSKTWDVPHAPISPHCTAADYQNKRGKDMGTLLHENRSSRSE